jgi:hypothetical protein
MTGEGWTVGFGERSHIYISPNGVEYRTTKRGKPDVVLMAKTPGLRDTMLKKLGRRAKEKLAKASQRKRRKKRKPRSTL